MTREIDRAAELWEKTKDPKYKDLWYKLIKEYVNGKISYIPSLSHNTLMSELKGYFDGQES